MPYHVRITPKSDKSHDIIKLDLPREQLEERILNPYRNGNPIVISGHTIPCDNIDSIKISYTEETSTQLIPIIKEERKKSRVVVIGISDDWYVTNRGINVTDDFIIGPPGHGKEESLIQQKTRSQEIVVIYGRNEQLKRSMFDFLRALGLLPLEWMDMVRKTGYPSPFVGEVLHSTFEKAQGFIIMLTPDDEAKLKIEFIKSNDPLYERELTSQARPNVFFEAGMAMGINLKGTIIVEIGNVRPFSDIEGRHIVKLDNSYEKRIELTQKLEIAGYKVDTSGEEWKNIGDFLVTGLESIEKSIFDITTKIGEVSRRNKKSNEDMIVEEYIERLPENAIGNLTEWFRWLDEKPREFEHTPKDFNERGCNVTSSGDRIFAVVRGWTYNFWIKSPLFDTKENKISLSKIGKKVLNRLVRKQTLD